MTLVVTVRTAGGIAVAADSLAWFHAPRRGVVEADVTCPDCRHGLHVRVQDPAEPATSWPSADKIFPFLGRYAVASYNAARLPPEAGIARPCSCDDTPSPSSGGRASPRRAEPPHMRPR